MASKLGHAGAGVLSMSVSGEQIRQKLAVAAERVASMLRHIPDSGVPVPRSEWSVGETAAHLVLAAAYYSEWITGTPSPFTSRESFFTNGVARSPVNAALLRECTEREPSRLADLIVDNTRRFIAAASRYPDRHPVRFHWAPVDVATFSAIALLHTVEHGYDIARALHRRFPIEPEVAGICVQALANLMPHLLNEKSAGGLNACIDIRVRGGLSFSLVLDKGTASVQGLPPRRPDCVVSADPVAFLLVGLGRRSQWGQIAKGKLASWGTRPWLALKLTRLFPAPG